MNDPHQHVPAPYQPQAMTPQQENEWAMYAHLSSLAGYIVPLGSILGPLVVWLMKKDQSALVDQHAKDALNFNLSMLVYAAVSVVLVLVFIGFFLLIAIGVGSVICTIMATLKAKDGQHFQYPMTIRFIQ